jgi:hypothetical protein
MDFCVILKFSNPIHADLNLISLLQKKFISSTMLFNHNASATLPPIQNVSLSTKLQTNFNASFNHFSIAHGILSNAIQKFSGISFIFSNTNHRRFHIDSPVQTIRVDIPHATILTVLRIIALVLVKK